MSIGPFKKLKNKKIYTKPKYRFNKYKYKNLMHDGNVFRGKTFLNKFDLEINKKPKIKRKQKQPNLVEIINPY